MNLLHIKNGPKIIPWKDKFFSLAEEYYTFPCLIYQKKATQKTNLKLSYLMDEQYKFIKEKIVAFKK